MGYWCGVGCRHGCAPRRRALTLLSVCLAPVLLGPPSAAGAQPAVTQTQEDLRLQELEAAADLEDSNAQVQQAAAALQSLNARLAAAKTDVATAKGRLAGAGAQARAARAEVARAEAATREAALRVQSADDTVQSSRDAVGRLARGTYQRGRLDALRQVMDADEPQEALRRAVLLRSVFRSQNDNLRRLTQDRLTLASEQADLAAEQRRTTAARQRAEQEEMRARAITDQAEQAAAAVSLLSAQQATALADAELLREQDVRDYEAAQAASTALAEKIRAAAARAAAARAAEAQRVAEAQRMSAAARAAAAAGRRSAAGQQAPAVVPPSLAPRKARMLWPASGRLSSRYGYRTHPLYGDRRMHNGIDIAAPNGTRISSADSGLVLFAGAAGGFGNLVVISHRTVDGKDLSTAYAHMQSISVSEGQLVDRGQQVGRVGSTGASTGNHLHFEVRLNGDPVDPLQYVERS